MFDISDPSEVKEIDRIILKDVTDCDALSNYRAILASVDKDLFWICLWCLQEYRCRKLLFL